MLKIQPGSAMYKANAHPLCYCFGPIISALDFSSLFRGVGGGAHQGVFGDYSWLIAH